MYALLWVALVWVVLIPVAVTGGLLVASLITRRARDRCAPAESPPMLSDPYELVGGHEAAASSVHRIRGVPIAKRTGAGRAAARQCRPGGRHRGWTTGS